MNESFPNPPNDDKEDNKKIDLNRRNFLKKSVLIGGALAAGVVSSFVERKWGTTQKNQQVKIMKNLSEQSGEQQNRAERKDNSDVEKERSFNFEFYVTDHSPDYSDTGNPEKLRELYADIKRDGVQSVRYDWHWRNVEPESGKYSGEHLKRYRQAKEIMQEVGLEEPTIILSNPPKWAVELYKTDKEKFFDAYRQYAEQVRDSLAQSGGRKISKIQILNELNNGVYTPVKTEDLPRMCQITRDVFREYNPDIKLMATLLASNTTKLVGTPIEQYLPEFKKIKDNFDIIAVDYYPGLWHFDIKDAKSWNPKDIFKHMVKQMGLLRTSFEEISTWGKEYELGEVGLPTKEPWGDEKSQRYFYDAFFRAYKQMMVDFRSKGIKLPSRVGFYQAIDEAPRNLLGKILRTATPFPEHDMGVRESSGRRKLVLQGSPHLPEKERNKKRSQLSKIISYLRAPVKNEEME